MTVPRQQPIATIQRHLDEAVKQGQSLLESPDASRADAALLQRGYRSWDGRNEVMLDSGFSVTGFLESGPKQEYLSFMGLTYPLGPEAAEEVTPQGLRADIERKIRRLEDIRGKLELYAVAEGVDPTTSMPGISADGDTIFIVHGRAEATRLAVENVLSRCVNSRYTVLGEQTNAGMTIIEKLEAHLGQRANYAVVLMTGDDNGALQGEGPKPRARQNVVLELGYAMAALGRQRVCLLCESAVDLPSDVAGITYIPLDPAGAWRTQLLAELKSAGFDVDANKLLPDL